MAQDQGERPKNIMLARLWRLYGMPDTPDPAGYIDEFARQVRGFSDVELHAATDHIVRKRDRIKRTWPTIGECLGACENARSTRLAEAKAETLNAQRLHKTHKPKDEMTAAERKRLFDFVDACAVGAIELGGCANALRQMAITMRSRRLAANAGNSPARVAVSELMEPKQRRW
jgi:hypothetical protein